MTKKILLGDIVKWDIDSDTETIGLIIARYKRENPFGYVVEEIVLIEQTCTVEQRHIGGPAGDAGYWWTLVARNSTP